MVKEQFRETDIGRVISHVQFTPFSSKDIAKQAIIQIVNRNLYLPDSSHTACPYGVLDHKLVNLILKLLSKIYLILEIFQRVPVKKIKNAIHVIKIWQLVLVTMATLILSFQFFMSDIFELV